MPAIAEIIDRKIPRKEKEVVEPTAAAARRESVVNLMDALRKSTRPGAWRSSRGRRPRRDNHVGQLGRR
jgi:non-homologous end joining protein Ku